MKRLTLCLATLAALTIMMPATSLAQNENQLGIFGDPTGTAVSANVTADPLVQFDVYLVLQNPVNPDFNGNPRAVEFVDGFECRVDWPSDPNFVVIGPTFPTNTIDVGSAPYIIAGYADSQPVVNNKIVLCTWTLMVANTDAFPVYLGLTRFPSVPGAMAYVDGQDPEDNNLAPAWPSSGDFGLPVFSVNGSLAVGIEGESWGGVKALFR